MAHTEADCKEPAEQGMWGIFQVFTDTIVMCTITALCILCSGAMTTGKDGGALSTAAFHTVFGYLETVLFLYLLPYLHLQPCWDGLTTDNADCDTCAEINC